METVYQIDMSVTTVLQEFCGFLERRGISRTTQRFAMYVILGSLAVFGNIFQFPGEVLQQSLYLFVCMAISFFVLIIMPFVLFFLHLRLDFEGASNPVKELNGGYTSWSFIYVSLLFLSATTIWRDTNFGYGLFYTSLISLAGGYWFFINRHGKLKPKKKRQYSMDALIDLVKNRQFRTMPNS